MESDIEFAVKQLRKGSNTQVYNALMALRTRHLRDRKEECVAKFREFGGPQSLIYLIQRPNHKIVDLALSILGNCCLEHETRKIVGRLQGVQHIVKILECLGKESVLNRACRTLANLAMDEQIAEEIMKGEAVHLILQLLDSSATTDTNLKQSAVRTLRILSSNATRYREEVVARGAVGSLAKILISEDGAKDEPLMECVLKTIVTLSKECGINFAEQIQNSEYLEKLVSLSAGENRTFCDAALHVLANASKQASLRPLLGNAGAVTSLVSRIEKWEKASNGWQWAVDALCQCTRESVNRVKVREGGGLKHLVSLLEEPADERLWLCSLSSIINFLYDDASFSLLVDFGMVLALVDKLSCLAASEKHSEHGISTLSCAVPAEIDVRVEWSFRPMLGDHRRPSQSSHHACCYSPESSPPYFTSFPSCSSPTSSRQSSSPCSFSPFRDASPLPLQHDEEPCYSPVYESGDSDTDDGEEGSKDSGNLEVTDCSGTTPSPSSVASDRADGNDVKCSSESVGGRSPIGDILLLLSRLSLEENLRSCLVSRGTLTALLDYVIDVGTPQLRAKRILSRVARNCLCFERLVILRIPELFRQKLILTPHEPKECSACEAVQVFGQSLMADLRFQAESPFGSGVLHHLILAGRNQEEKMSALLAALYLVGSSKVQQQILLDTDGLAFLTGLMSDVEHSDFDAVVNGIVHLAQKVLSRSVGPIPDDVSEPVKDASAISCRYVDSIKGDGDGDLVELTVDSCEGHLMARRSVLARGCDVFNAMLCGSFAESRLGTVSLQDTTFEALEYVVHFLHSCHSGSCPVLRADGSSTTSSLLQALSLADKLLLPNVKDVVTSCLISRQAQLTDAECVDAFVLSKIYDCPRLSAWIVRNTLTSSRFPDHATRNRRIRELSSNCRQFTVDAWQLIAYAISTIT